MAEKKFVDQYIEYHTGKEWVNKSTINTDEQELRNTEGDFLGLMPNIIRDLRAVLFGSSSELEQETINVELPKKDAKPNKKGQYKQKDLEIITKLAWGPTKVVKTVGEKSGRKDGEVFSRYTTTPLGDGRTIVGRYHEEGARNAAAAIHMFILPSGTTLTPDQIEKLPFMDNDTIKKVGETGKLEKLDADSLNIEISTPTPPTSSTETTKTNINRSVEQIYANIYNDSFQKFLSENPKLQKAGKEDKALASFIKEEKKSNPVFAENFKVAETYKDWEVLYDTMPAEKEKIDFSFILNGGHRHTNYAPSEKYEKTNINPKILFFARNDLAPEEQMQEVRNITTNLKRLERNKKAGKEILSAEPADIFTTMQNESFEVFAKNTNIDDPNLAKALFFVYTKNHESELDKKALDVAEASAKNIPLEKSPKSKEIESYAKKYSKLFDSFKETRQFADENQAKAAFYFQENYDKEFSVHEEPKKDTSQPEKESPQPEKAHETETPKDETPKDETPKDETPKGETPKETAEEENIVDKQISEIMGSELYAERLKEIEGITDEKEKSEACHKIASELVEAFGKESSLSEDELTYFVDALEQMIKEDVEKLREQPETEKDEVPPVGENPEETVEVTPQNSVYTDENGVNYYYLPYKNGETQDILRIIKNTDGKTYINVQGLDGQPGTQTCEITGASTKTVDGKTICSLQISRNGKTYDMGLPIDATENPEFATNIQKLIDNTLEATIIEAPIEVNNPTYNSEISNEIVQERETEVNSKVSRGKNLQEIQTGTTEIMGQTVPVASQQITLQNAANKAALPPQTLSVIESENILISISRNGKPVVVVTKDADSKIHAHIDEEFAKMLEPKDKLGLGEAADGYYDIPIEKLKFSETKGLEAGEVRGAGSECAFLISAINAQFRDKNGNDAGMKGIDIENGTGKAFDIALGTEFMKMAARHENGCELEGNILRDAALVAQATLARSKSPDKFKTIGINIGDGYIYSVPIVDKNNNRFYANIKVGLDGSTSIYMQLGEGKGKTQPKFETITSAALRAESASGDNPQLVLELESGTASKKMVKLNMNNFKDNTELVDLLSGALPEATRPGENFFEVTDTHNHETNGIGEMSVGKAKHKIYPRTSEEFADIRNVSDVGRIVSGITETETDDAPPISPTPDIPDPTARQIDNPPPPPPPENDEEKTEDVEKDKTENPEKDKTKKPEKENKKEEKQEDSGKDKKKAGSTTAKTAAGILLFALAILAGALAIFFGAGFGVFAMSLLGLGTATLVGLFDPLLDPGKSAEKAKNNAKSKEKNLDKSNEKHKSKLKEKISKILGKIGKKEKQIANNFRQRRALRRITKHNMNIEKADKETALKKAKAKNNAAKTALKSYNKLLERAQKGLKKFQSKVAQHIKERDELIKQAKQRRVDLDFKMGRAKKSYKEIKERRDSFFMGSLGTFLAKHNKKQEAIHSREEAQSKLDKLLPKEKSVDFTKEQLKNVEKDFIESHNKEQLKKASVKKRLPQIESVEELHDILENKDGKYNSANYERTRKLYENMLKERQNAITEAEAFESSPEIQAAKAELESAKEAEAEASKNVSDYIKNNHLAVTEEQLLDSALKEQNLREAELSEAQKEINEVQKEISDADNYVKDLESNNQKFKEDSQKVIEEYNQNINDYKKEIDKNQQEFDSSAKEIEEINKNYSKENMRERALENTRAQMQEAAEQAEEENELENVNPFEEEERQRQEEERQRQEEEERQRQEEAEHAAENGGLEYSDISPTKKDKGKDGRDMGK